MGFQFYLFSNCLRVIPMPVLRALDWWSRSVFDWLPCGTSYKHGVSAGASYNFKKTKMTAIM